ncbi:MAG: LysR family transcriptional regulator [Novosphingobium sp.]
MSVELNAIGVFLAVAEARSFRRASERLGITRSAVSQSVRKLEDRLGTALLLRTTRSVSLTEAGERLFERLSPAMAEMGAALSEAGDRDAAPSGRLRIAVSSIAEWFLAGPLFATFLDAHPGVQLDIGVTDDEFDIVAQGYDAGVRLGEVVEQDMIALKVSADQRQTVVASPGYLARFGAPNHPQDLVDHRCIGWRPAPDVAPYRWEFAENGRDFAVALDPQLTTNDMRVMVNTALAGGGLTFGMEETFTAHLQAGTLVSLLEDYCPSFPGFFLYFPARRNIAPKLRALIDHIKRQRAQA